MTKHIEETNDDPVQLIREMSKRYVDKQEKEEELDEMGFPLPPKKRIGFKKKVRPGGGNDGYRFSNLDI